jgi:4-hydroxybenzoate polyprenyltransferase
MMMSLTENMKEVRPTDLYLPHTQPNSSQPTTQPSLSFHLRTFWLFTRSDLKTVLLPQTIFGLVVALSGPLLTTNSNPQPLSVLQNIPQTVLYIWLNLLNEVISNQLCPNALAEDSINKPWRPLPSRRLTPEKAKTILLYVIPTIYVMGLFLGGAEAAVALMVFSHMHNELDGASKNWVVRNILNGCGLSCFSIGAAVVATGYGTHSLTEDTYTWVALLAAVIATTIQMQDLPDVEGDRATDRKTIVVVYGDSVTRWSVAVGVLFWSGVCCWYWDLNAAWYLPYVGMGAVMAARVLLIRDVKGDDVTWKMWGLWMMTLYLLPLVKRIEGGWSVGGLGTAG